MEQNSSRKQLSRIIVVRHFFYTNVLLSSCGPDCYLAASVVIFVKVVIVVIVHVPDFWLVVVCVVLIFTLP